MKKYAIILVSFVLMGFVSASAQVGVSIPDTTLSSNGESVSLPLNVSNFNNIGSVSLRISYDPNVLTFDGIPDNLPGTLTFNAAGGVLSIAWFDTNPMTLGDSVFLHMNFTHQNGSSELNFVKSDCEIADSSATTLAVNYINGKITGPQSPAPDSTSPDVWITLDDGTVISPDSGSTTTYTIKYGNKGTGDLLNAVVVDSLPEGMSYSSSSGGNETSTGVVEFNIGTLAAGDSGEVTLTALISAKESNYLNTAYIKGTDASAADYDKTCQDLNVSDTTSDSDNSGLESRGDLAELLLRRQWKVQYGMTTPILRKKGLKSIQSAISLNSLIPSVGPFNSTPVEGTPFDILGVSNAISSYAVNYNLYTSGTNVRVGGIFSSVTPAPNIYDHSKAVCDRLGGYAVENIELININGYKFYGVQLSKPDKGLNDYAISFSVYETPSGFKIQNKWTYEEYSAPDGASSVYNFEVWSNSYSNVSELVKGILSRLKSYGPMEYLNTQQYIPDVFIKTAKYTHDGKIHLVMENKSTAKQINFNLAYRVAQGDNQLTESKSYDVPAGQSDLTITTGIVADANLYMDQTNGFKDEVYVSGGAYTYLTGPNSTVNNFNTAGYPQQSVSSYPDGALVLSGGASIDGSLGDWTSVVRSLSADGNAYDLSSYKGVRFDASGTGTVQVILNMTDTKNYNYYAYKVTLTGETKTYEIDFNKFKELYGSQTPFDASKIEDIGFIFSTEYNTSLTSFNMDVENIAFLSSSITGIKAENSAPAAFSLQQNYPNPFNPTTVIGFNVPKQSQITLTVYNIIGQKVATLVNGQLNAGYHSVNFNAVNLASGIYFYRLEGDNLSITKKMILTK